MKYNSMEPNDCNPSVLGALCVIMEADKAFIWFAHISIEPNCWSKHEHTCMAWYAEHFKYCCYVNLSFGLLLSAQKNLYCMGCLRSSIKNSWLKLTDQQIV